MIYLAIDTSTRSASVCLLDDSQVIGDSGATISGPATVNLLPAIKRILDQLSYSAADIDAVAISTGPGSFTGLRLGVSTAKTLAYAVGCLVFPISTHEVLARQALPDPFDDSAGSAEKQVNLVDRIATVIDAQRGQWFAGLFEISAHRQVLLQQDSTIVDPQQFVDSLEGKVLICGSGLIRHEKKIDWPDNVRLSAPDCWIPQARTVGLLVAAKTGRFEAVDPFGLLPVYGRLSAAEEKLDN